MTTQVLSILNGSSAYYQIRRTTIKSWMGLNFVKFPSPITELAPLSILKFDGQCCDHSSVHIFDRIFFILYVTRKTIKSWMSLKFYRI